MVHDFCTQNLELIDSKQRGPLKYCLRNEQYNHSLQKACKGFCSKCAHDLTKVTTGIGKITFNVQKIRRWKF